MRRVVARLLVALLGGSMLLLGVQPPAANADRVGDAEEFTVEFDSAVIPGAWWACDGTGWWVVPTGGGASTATIVVEMECSRGWAMNEINIVGVQAKGASCLREAAGPGDIDEDENQSFDAVLVGSGCTGGAGVTELCLIQEFTSNGDFARNEEWCGAFPLGAPPSPGTGHVVTPCPRADLVPPVVRDWAAVSVSGGWVWEQVVYFQAYGINARSSVTLDGVNPFLMGYIGYASAASLTVTSLNSPTQSVFVNGSGGTRTAAVSFDYGASGFETVSSNVLRVRTPVMVTAIGSTAVSTIATFKGAGYYLEGGFNWGPQGSSSGFSSSRTEFRPDSQFADFSTNPVGDVGYNLSSRCYANWGPDWCTSGAGCSRADSEPLGPVPTVPATDPDPTPYDPGGGHAGPIPPDYVPPVAPTGPTGGDDDDDCAGFDPDDSATWGDSSGCMIVLLLIQANDTLETIVVELHNGFDAVVAAIEGLELGGGGGFDPTALLTPSPGLWPDIWADFELAWTGSTLDEWDAALSGMVPTAGTSDCAGPGIPPIPIGSSVSTPEMHLFDACGDRATAASMVRGTVFVLVTFAGAWRIWDISLGSVGAYRGGGRHMSDSTGL